MHWDHYIPLAVVGRQFDTQNTRLGPTIWDFAGTTPRQMSSELDAIVQDCVGRGGRHLLVNIDGTCLMNLMGSYQNMSPASFGGAVPLRLDTGTQAPMPDSISLIIEAGDCLVVDTSTDQQEIRDHLGRFISDTLIDATVGTNGQSEYHFITTGGSHIPTWYRLGPFLELEGVAELLAFHLAGELRGKSIEMIIPWAEPGIQLAIRLASSLSAGADERVGYVVLVKDSLSGGQPEISDLDEASIKGKRVLLLTDVLCAGETIRKLSDEVNRCGGYVGAVAGILNYGRSAQLGNALDSITAQNDRQLVAWTREKTSTLPRPPKFDGAHWLCEVLDPVYPDAAQCRECRAGKPYALLWSSYARRVAVSTGTAEIDSRLQINRSDLTWSKFWLGAHSARSIGQVEHNVECNHCHDGQVLDVSRLRDATDLWDDITQWAGLEIENAIRAKSPADTEPIYLVTSPSRGSTILAGELARQYEQLQGPHIVTRDPHSRRWGSTAVTLPPGKKCILIDDQIFNADTIMGMLIYVERSGGQVLGIVSTVYGARGDDHYELVRALKERDIPFSAAYVAALQWSDKNRCRSHASFELLSELDEAPGWSSQFVQWYRSTLDPLRKSFESPDTFAGAELAIGRMFRRRQREWDSHFMGRFADQDLSAWTQLVSDWHMPDGASELGPEFAVAATDFGASLEPRAAIHMIRNLLQEQPNPKMAVAISDLIDALPLDLCRQQQNDLAELFEKYRAHLISTGRSPLDRISVALFNVLWDVNLDKEKWLYDVLANALASESQLYGAVLAVVLVNQRTPGEIRTTIRRLQTLRDNPPRGRSLRAQPTANPLMEVALKDLDHYRELLERKSGANRNEVAILTSSSDEIEIREVNSDNEEHFADDTILIDFNTSRLIIGGRHIPTKRRHGSDTLLSLASLMCLYSPGITTSHFRRFLEPRAVISDTASTARQAMLTLRQKNGICGSFLIQKSAGANRMSASAKSPWIGTINDGWKWVILDSPSQNNLAALRAFVQGL